MNNLVRELILPFLPSVLTIIGWWIVGRRDNKSRKNAIHNRRIDSASKLMDKILVDAKFFYSLSGSDVQAKNLRLLIISDFKKLSAIINLISKEIGDVEKESIAYEFIEYKKAVTGGEFETISRFSVVTSNQIYVEIDMAYQDLYIELEKSYLI